MIEYTGSTKGGGPCSGLPHTPLLAHSPLRCLAPFLHFLKPLDSTDEASGLEKEACARSKEQHQRWSFCPIRQDACARCIGQPCVVSPPGFIRLTRTEPNVRVCLEVGMVSPVLRTKLRWVVVSIPQREGSPQKRHPTTIADLAADSKVTMLVNVGASK